MTPSDHTQTIPAAYVHLILKLCAERGVDTGPLSMRLDDGLLQEPDGRLPLMQLAQLLNRIVDRDPAISYEIGLNATLTTHGFVGMGLMALPDVRAAVDFGSRYVSLRTPFVAFNCEVEGQMAAIRVDNTMPLGTLRQFVFEHFLVGIWCIAQKLANTIRLELRDAEILFDFPQPEHHARYRDRLPPCRFDQSRNALRFPAAFLDLPLTTSDNTAAQLVRQQCERELAEVGLRGSGVLSRVQAVLARDTAPPPLADMARRLHLSPRSLKRKLAAEGTSYKKVVEQHRRQLASRWLRGDELSVAGIASRLGYTDPANFSRAFRKWTGQAPTDFREAAAD